MKRLFYILLFLVLSTPTWAQTFGGTGSGGARSVVYYCADQTHYTGSGSGSGFDSESVVYCDLSGFGGGNSQTAWNAVSYCGTESFSGSSGSGFSATIGACLVPLPVEWLGFEAYKKNTSVQLIWETASETNNSHFEIQRAGTDLQFKSIGLMEGKGNANYQNSYEFEDNDPLQGVNYYRLMQVDYNGGFDFSKVRTVEFFSQSDIRLSMYPNPVKNNELLYFEYPFDSNATISIFNIYGKKMISISKTPENREIAFQVNLNPGVYIVESSVNMQIFVSKLIVE
jgi:hypothetical protein